MTIGDRSALLIWHAAELTVTMVAIGIPVCRPLWKDWVSRLLGDQHQIDSKNYYNGEQRTIGGSEMKLASKDSGSKSRSKSRKGSNARPSDIDVHLDSIAMLDVPDERDIAATPLVQSPDSWASWSRA